jgi:hypothetical protein
MYAGSRRPMDMVTISTDTQAKTAAVLEFLKSQFATTRNVQASPVDILAMQKDAGLKWNPGQPFTLVIGPDGKILFQKEGRLDIYEVRRVILASFPDAPGWPGIHEYYQAAVARTAARKK